MDEFNSLNNIKKQFKKIAESIIDESRSVIRTSSYCLIKEQIKGLAEWILNSPPQHKNSLIQCALEKYTGILCTGIKFFPEVTEGLFKICLLFHPYIETQEKALMLSLTGQKYYIQLTLGYWVRVISKVVSDYNLTDIVIQKAVKRWKTEAMIKANIKNISNSSPYKEKSFFQYQNTENLYFTIVDRIFSLFPQDLNRFINVPLAFDQSDEQLIQNAKDLSKDEKDIFINILFHEPYESTETLVREMNVILADFFGYIKTPVRNFPTPVRVKKFIDDSNTPPKRPFSLSGEFTKETMKKRLSLEHIYLIKKAMIEFKALNIAGHERAYGVPWPKKLNPWRKNAIKYFKTNPKQFKLILLEDLEDNTFFEGLAQLDETQFIRNVRGKIIQKIFERNALDEFGIEKINDMVKKLEEIK